MTNSYSWNLTEESSEVSPNDLVPDNVKVERFALSYILMPFCNYPQRTITTVNLHPDTWNSFMFPYGGLRIEDSEAAAGAASFRDLSKSLHQLIRLNLEPYLTEAHKELSAYYSEVPDLHNVAPIFRNYSLKFSKSADQWTAYIFTYHTCAEGLLAAPGVTRGKIKLTPEEVKAAQDSKQIEGVSLEENVVAFLYSNIIKFWSGVDV